MKAMGIESDQEVTQLIGSEGAYAGLFAPSLQECKQQGVFTQQQALEWLGQSPLYHNRQHSPHCLVGLTLKFAENSPRRDAWKLILSSVHCWVVSQDNCIQYKLPFHCYYMSLPCFCICLLSVL